MLVHLIEFGWESEMVRLSRDDKTKIVVRLQNFCTLSDDHRDNAWVRPYQENGNQMIEEMAKRRRLWNPKVRFEATSELDSISGNRIWIETGRQWSDDQILIGREAEELAKSKSQTSEKPILPDHRTMLIIENGLAARMFDCNEKAGRASCRSSKVSFFENLVRTFRFLRSDPGQFSLHLSLPLSARFAGLYLSAPVRQKRIGRIQIERMVARLKRLNAAD